MLYTVVPLERIYSTRFHRSNGLNQGVDSPKNIEYKDIPLDHGFLRTRAEGDQCVVDSIISTDLKDYLNVNYVPGSIFSGNQ